MTGVTERPRPARPAARLCSEAGPAGAVDPALAQARNAWPVSLVPDGEAILYWSRPSLLFIPLSVAGTLATFVLLSVILAVLALTAPWAPWLPGQAWGLGATLILLRLAWQTLEWYCRIHVMTDRRIVVRSGVLRVSVYQAPLREIEQTRLFVRLRERFFGLGTIGFATAGTGGFDAFWVMIREPHQTHRMVMELLRRYRHGSG